MRHFPFSSCSRNESADEPSSVHGRSDKSSGRHKETEAGLSPIPTGRPLMKPTAEPSSSQRDTHGSKRDKDVGEKCCKGLGGREGRPERQTQVNSLRGPAGEAGPKGMSQRAQGTLFPGWWWPWGLGRAWGLWEGMGLVGEMDRVGRSAARHQVAPQRRKEMRP
jgi:hypothetical protein